MLILANLLCSLSQSHVQRLQLYFTFKTGHRKSSTPVSLGFSHQHHGCLSCSFARVEFTSFMNISGILKHQPMLLTLLVSQTKDSHVYVICWQEKSSPLLDCTHWEFYITMGSLVGPEMQPYWYVTLRGTNRKPCYFTISPYPYHMRSDPLSLVRMKADQWPFKLHALLIALLIFIFLLNCRNSLKTLMLVDHFLFSLYFSFNYFTII